MTEDFWPLNTTLYVRDVKGNDTQYLAYFLRTVDLQSHSGKSGVPGINRNDIHKLPISLPTISEQRSIAKALSDVDGLLEAMEALIAKKRAIKRGTMQQLLTAKTRLPGFAGEWKRKPLGDIVSIRDAKVLPANVEIDTLCVELDHIGQGTGQLLERTTARGSVSSKYHFFRGDVLFSRLRSYLRKYWHADCDGICTTELWPLVANLGETDEGFLYAIVQSDGFVDASSVSYGTHMPRADWSVMRNLEILLPDVCEQRAIGAVLSEMDAEIDALEKRKDKIGRVKQGMMQQLLTGRKRLSKAQEETEQTEVADSVVRKHNWQFNEAVVISVLAKHFGSEQYPLGRKRYTKLLYLLHRHKEGHVEGYLKKAAGPYNPRNRYGGPERIALEKGYIRRHKDGKYLGFVAYSRVGEATEYFGKWYGRESLQWLDQFRYKKNDELELLTTVDMAAEELRAADKEVSVENVKHVILGHREWKAKVDRPLFADVNLARAVEDSRRLFGVSGERDTA